MSDPIKFNIRADKVERILSSKKSELRALMKLAGGDAVTFYAEADLSGVDLRGQNVRALNFDGSDLTNVAVDEHTQFDARAFLNSSLRVDFLEISRNAAERHLTREPWLDRAFTRSVGISPRVRHSADEINFQIVERNILDRVIEAHEFRLNVTAYGFQILKKFKIVLSFLELNCFARFLADLPLPSELIFEQFDHWRQNRNPSGVERSDDEVAFYNSPDQFMFIDALDYLVFLNKGGQIDKKATSAAIRRYGDLVDRLVDSPLLRNFRTGK